VAGSVGAGNTSTSSNSQLLTPNSNFGGTSNNQTLGAVRQVVNVPVAGATAFTDSRGAVVVRYVERETGHVQDQPITEKVSSRVTDTTIPKIFNAIFGKDGKFLVFQSLSGKFNQLNTAFADIKKALPATSTQAADTALLGEQNLSTVVGNLDGTLLPATVHRAVASPDKLSYLYFNESSDGALAVIVPGDKSKLAKSLTTVFSSKLTEWAPDWPTTNTVTFTTRPASNLPGYMYSVNVSNKQKTLLLKNVLGLTASMSPDGSTVLYTESSGTGFISRLYDVKLGTITNFPLRTYPEKCLWSKKTTSVVYCAAPAYFSSGTYPDDWYIGATSFSDALWRVNVKTGETTQIVPVADNRANAQDMIKLFTDEKELNLFWVNKSDTTVWTVPL
jgi:hypothetical protein